MEIVLLEKIRNLGDVGQVVNVKDGYGRNFLIKFGKALRADKKNIEYVNKKRSEINKKNIEQKRLAKDVYEKIKKNKKGNFVHFKIEIEGKLVKEIEKQLSIDTNVIRYLTVKYDKIDLKNEFFGSKK